MWRHQKGVFKTPFMGFLKNWRAQKRLEWWRGMGTKYRTSKGLAGRYGRARKGLPRGRILWEYRVGLK